MPTLIEDGFEYDGCVIRVETFPQGDLSSSGSFVRGDLVKASSGELSIAKAAASSVAAGRLDGSVPDPVLGFALMDGSTDANDRYNEIQVLIPNDDTLFALPIVHSTHGSSTLGISQLLSQYGITHLDENVTNYTRSGSKPWCIDISDTTNPYARVVRFFHRPDWVIPGREGAAYSATGEKFGWVWFKFNGTGLQF